jgi:predicted Zn-dependent protease with MMP-like domain
MREIAGPPLRAAALCAFIVGLTLLFLNPPSLAGLEDLLTIVAAAVAIALITAWGVVALSRDEMPEPEFQRLTDRSERLASMPAPDEPPTEFDELVVEALDELPEEFQEVLRRVPVVVSEQGHEHRAYGLYVGDTVARDNYPDKILIYRDTLERDFGHHPEVLREQVRRTVRHEIAHHLGWDEPGVRGLGL